jgi:hypothetical protein
MIGTFAELSGFDRLDWLGAGCVFLMAEIDGLIPSWPIS